MPSDFRNGLFYLGKPRFNFGEGTESTTEIDFIEGARGIAGDGVFFVLGEKRAKGINIVSINH